MLKTRLITYLGTLGIVGPIKTLKQYPNQKKNIWPDHIIANTCDYGCNSGHHVLFLCGIIKKIMMILITSIIAIKMLKIIIWLGARCMEFHGSGGKIKYKSLDVR